MATTGELDDPPEGLRVRPGTTNDAEAITRVINDVCVAQIGVPWIAAPEIRDAFRVPRRVPGLGPVVLVDPSEVVVGYLSFGVNHDPFEVDLFCWVALELAGRGVSAWFLRFAERRALAAAPAGSGVKVSAGAFRGVDAGRRLMEALGYAPERTFWVMRGEVASLPAADALTGIEIRRYRPGVDDVEIHGALSEAFDDHWGWPFAPYDEWREAAIEGEGSGYDPGFWFVATENGAIVGASIAIASSPRNEHAAYVQDLGVRRVWRRRGIATALLAATFAEARSRGITEVELAVDSESATGAPVLYERAGMRAVYAWEEWTKAIPAGD